MSQDEEPPAGLVNLELELVDLRVRVDELAGERRVALEQRADGGGHARLHLRGQRQQLLAQKPQFSVAGRSSDPRLPNGSIALVVT
jgi:hypothetical protein